MPLTIKLPNYFHPFLIKNFFTVNVKIVDVCIEE